jgi:Alw26I/Eco31I/Esp3I family type II restriction endonuclease
MKMIVNHPNFSGMPNAVGPDGRINWQVSSGKSTSFYKNYVARQEWWVAKADALHLPGVGNSEDRFTIAARLINPTGYRPCRLCGEERNVGYFYLSAHGVRALSPHGSGRTLSKWDSISEVLSQASDAARKHIGDLFPERAQGFGRWGVSVEAFENTNHIRTTLLSPGYMGNPPDRLDGFHDYCLYCRGKSDPGRSAENLRSYTQDRRAFEFWAEGNWALAQDLYNLAGEGFCRVCGKHLARVSPDHVGPLACGFAQIPLFEPMCGPHNSSKQRRLTADDVQGLIAYELSTGMSSMSWYSRDFWDEAKAFTTDDADALALSNELRSRQDIYLRALEVLRRHGLYSFLRSLLSPESALEDHTFVGLNPANFTFSRITSRPDHSSYRQSLARRSVRIALESLIEYVGKPAERRKKDADLDSQVEAALVAALGQQPQELVTDSDLAWSAVDVALAGRLHADELDREVGKVLWHGSPDTRNFARLRSAVISAINSLTSP